MDRCDRLRVPLGSRLELRSQLVGAVLSYVRRAGGDPQALLERFALAPTAETDPELVLPIDDYHRLLDAAAEAIADPFLGLHIAAHHRRGRFGLLEFSMRSAATVREAMQRFVRYISLVNDLMVVIAEDRSNEATIEQHIPGIRLGLGRHGNEHLIATLILETRKMVAAPFVPRRVWFAHPAPDDVSELVEVLGTSSIEFDVGRNGMALSQEVLDLRFSSADPALLAALDRQLQPLAAAPQNASRLVDDVRHVIRNLLMQRSAPTIELCARALGMSERTLQRRLTAAGLTFRGLVGSVRKEVARTLLHDRTRPIGEVAF